MDITRRCASYHFSQYFFFQKRILWVFLNEEKREKAPKTLLIWACLEKHRTLVIQRLETPGGIIFPIIITIVGNRNLTITNL